MRVGFVVFASSLCIASAACAQDTDPVTLYGRVYGLVESVEARGGTLPAARRSRVTDQASLIGLRGKEDLGSGQSAWFQLETGFAVDSPGSFGTRNSGVGFEGPWGTFVVGRWISAFEASQVGGVDPFDHQGLPDIAGAAMNQGNYTRRERNTVQHWSRRVSGFRTRVTYVANEARTTGLNPYDYSLSVSFLDPVTYIALAFEKHRDQVAGTPTPGSDEDGRGVAGYYRFGSVKLSGQYGLYRRTGTVTQRSYMMGLEAVSGAHALLGSYQFSRNGGVFASITQPRCHLFGAGYRYRFSPRTFFIAQYARVNNRIGALCNFGTNPLAISEGQDLLGMAVGLRTGF